MTKAKQKQTQETQGAHGVRVGDRVGAVMAMDPEVALVYGYGVYEGDHAFDTESDSPVGALADMARGTGVANPRIRLDSGSVVWGCECWWAPEDDVRKDIARRRIVTPVDIEAVRADHIEKHGERSYLRIDDDNELH